MYKRIIQIILILAGLAVIGYVYYKFSKEDKGLADPLDTMPANAVFLLEVKGFNDLGSYMPLLKSMSSSENELAGVSFNPLNEWHSILHELDSVRGSSPDWNALLQKSSVVLSSSEQGRGDSWLLAVGLPVGTDAAQFMKYLEAWKAPSSNREFKGAKIYESGNLQSALINDCLILSPTSSLIEDVIIRNEKKELLRRDERFSDVKALVSSDIPFHFFIKLNDTDWLQLDPTFYKKEKENTSDLARFSGYCSVSDSSHHPFILTGSDMTTSIASTLPAKTSILDIYAYPDFETGWSRHDFFHTNTAASKFWSRAWQDLGDTCQCDLNEAMLSWRSGIWGSAVISLNDSATAEVSFFGMRDSIDVIPLMRSVLVEQSTRPDKIYTIKYPELFERNQQQSILVDANYITQVNDVVFVAATPNELMAVTNSAAKLDQETSFQLARNATNKNGGRFIYQSEYYTSVLPSIWINTLRGFPFVTTQVERVKDNKYLVSVDVPFKQNTSSASSPASPASETVNEDTGKIIHGPWTVINHNTKDKEQLIQNDKKEICLIGSDGKILWRKKFDSEIFGDVTQVDALKNGKLQMAFSTENGIHILDRNGEELKGFPILPKPPLTAPLHIADYENNKKYRLLYAAGDDWLNNQTIEGKATEGWKYNGAGMILWIDHFKVANEDVILTVSPLGNIQLLKRTGEVKTTTSAVLEKYNGGKIKIEPGATLEETKVTYTNKAGEEKSVPLGK